MELDTLTITNRKQLQDDPKFKSGNVDIDALCAELSAKAKCTETGVRVPKGAVEEALRNLAGNSSDSKQQADGQISSEDTTVWSPSDDQLEQAGDESSRSWPHFYVSLYSQLRIDVILIRRHSTGYAKRESGQFQTYKRHPAMNPNNGHCR